MVCTVVDEDVDGVWARDFASGVLHGQDAV